MEKLYALTERDRELFDEVLRRIGELRSDEPSGGGAGEDNQASDVHLCLPPPGGIPAIRGDEPGYAYCKMYRLVPKTPGSDQSLVSPIMRSDNKTHLIKKVENVNTEVIPRNYTLAVKLKGRGWVAVCPCSVTITGTGSTGTGTTGTGTSGTGTSGTGTSGTGTSGTATATATTGTGSLGTGSTGTGTGTSSLPTAPCGCVWIILNWDIYPAANCLDEPVTGRWVEYAGGGGSNCSIVWDECVGGPYAPGTFDGEAAPC